MNSNNYYYRYLILHNPKNNIYVTCSGKRCISVKKLKIELLASKESSKLALSNDVILTLVAASVFAP